MLLHREVGVLLGLRVVAPQVAEQDVVPGLEVHGELGAPALTADAVICIARLLVRGDDRGRGVCGFADDVLLDEIGFVLFLVDRQVAGRDAVGFE